MPLLKNLAASGFDDLHDIAQYALRNLGIVIAEIARSGLCNQILVAFAVGEP